MPLFNTIHKRKSAVKTAIVMALMLLSFFFVGMQYMDPPEEMGIEVNLGNSDVGSGDIQPLEPIKTVKQETTKVEEVEEAVEEPKQDTPSEDVATQDMEESIRIKKEAEAKRKIQEEANRKVKEKQEAERKAKAEADRIKREQEAKKHDLDNLMGGLNNSDGANTGGEGDDQTGGDKGQINGNPYANSYYGGGSGHGGNGSGYGLKGRNRKSNDKFVQDCNEEGKVVVKIEVNRQGKVIKAVPGVKGTTNTAACLMEPARKTALSYRFNADSKAPSKQIGFIVINFRLGE
jgi:outer membrane biosynthesis protein TonB